MSTSPESKLVIDAVTLRWATDLHPTAGLAPDDGELIREALETNYEGEPSYRALREE